MRGNNNILTAVFAIVALMLFFVLPQPMNWLAAVSVITALLLLKSSVLCVNRANVSNFGFYPTLYPVVITADKAKDVGVDIIDFDAASFLVNVGAISGAGVVLPVAQECDTLGGTYTDVAAADLEGAFVNCVANTVQKVGYKGTKRFLAIRMDYVSGTNVLAGGTILTGYPSAAKVV